MIIYSIFNKKIGHDTNIKYVYFFTLHFFNLCFSGANLQEKSLVLYHGQIIYHGIHTPVHYAFLLVSLTRKTPYSVMLFNDDNLNLFLKNIFMRLKKTV